MTSGQQAVEGSSDAAEHDIVDRSAIRVHHTLDVGQVAGDRSKASEWPRGSVQGRGRQATQEGKLRLNECLCKTNQRRRESPGRPQNISRGVGHELGARGAGARERRVLWFAGSICKSGQDRQSNHAVRKDVVKTQDEGGVPGIDVDDQRRGPERAVSWEGVISRPAAMSRTAFCPASCGTRAPHDGDVISDSELRIIHPNGSSIEEGKVYEFLPQARNGGKSPVKCRQQTRRVQPCTGIKDENRSDLNWRPSTVRVQRHQVIDADPVHLRDVFQPLWSLSSRPVWQRFSEHKRPFLLVPRLSLATGPLLFRSRKGR